LANSVTMRHLGSEIKMPNNIDYFLFIPNTA
jgi:hypothetical protein